MVVVVKELISNASGTFSIVGLTAAISILAFCFEQVYHKLSLHPYGMRARKRFYTFLTAGFVHNSLIHLVFNLVFLYLIGHVLENHMVSLYGFTHTGFVLLYCCAVMVCNLAAALLNFGDFLYRSAGASAAILAMMASYSAFRFSEGLENFQVFDGLVFAYLFLLLSVAGYHILFTRKNFFFDHDAHLSGIISGVLVTGFLLLNVLKDIRMIY